MLQSKNSAVLNVFSPAKSLYTVSNSAAEIVQVYNKASAATAAPTAPICEPSLSPAPVEAVVLDGVADVVEPEDSQHWANTS